MSEHSPKLPVDPNSLAQEIKNSCPTESDHDFTLITDGSGHQDGFGGCSAIVVGNKDNKFHACRYAAYCGTSTDRAEFLGLIQGLHTILDFLGAADNSRMLSMYEECPISVYWMCDRQSLVLSVYRGEGCYRRRSSPDLWHSFEYYERYFKISPIYVPRENDDPRHKLADKIASECRILAKEYEQTI